MLHPRVILQIRQLGAIGRVWDQDLREEIFGYGGNVRLMEQKPILENEPSAENQSGYSKSAFLIFWNNAAIVFSSNGK
jgi:hypothetical protein